MTTIKLIAIAKNESVSLPSWIFHHFRIGVDFIEIYINNSDDNSLEICKRIKAVEPNFNYFQADRLMSACNKKPENFQMATYNRSIKLSQTLQDDVTHFLLLDLDEYLTPIDLQSNLKNLIAHHPYVDIFSFLWYSDDFKSQRPAFSKTFHENANVYMMNHVKSMAKKNIIEYSKHHNFITKKQDNQLLNLLVGTDNVFLDDKLNTDLDRQRIKNSYLSQLQAIKPIEWFVHHRIYSSCTEYLAALLRGRSHNNDSSPIKVNRWGRKPPNLTIKIDAYQLNIPEPIIDLYYSEYDSFIDRCGLKDEIHKSQTLLRERARSVINLVENNPDILRKYPRVFDGIDFNEFKE